MAANPPGYIPMFGQGVWAKEHQEGTEGGKEWLKSEKLHKYWPMFSQWSYEDILSLTEDNLDSMMASVGASGITVGARGRLLSRLAELRQREAVLGLVAAGRVRLKEAAEYIAFVLRTPLPSDPGHHLNLQLVAATAVVYRGGRTSTRLPLFIRQKIETVVAQVINKALLKDTLAILGRSSQSHLNSRSNNPVRSALVQLWLDRGHTRTRMYSEDSGFGDSEPSYVPIAPSPQNLYLTSAGHQASARNVPARRWSSFQDGSASSQTATWAIRPLPSCSSLQYASTHPAVWGSRAVESSALQSVSTSASSRGAAQQTRPQQCSSLYRSGRTEECPPSLQPSRATSSWPRSQQSALQPTSTGLRSAALQSASYHTSASRSAIRTPPIQPAARSSFEWPIKPQQSPAPRRANLAPISPQQCTSLLCNAYPDWEFSCKNTHSIITPLTSDEIRTYSNFSNIDDEICKYLSALDIL